MNFMLHYKVFIYIVLFILHPYLPIPHVLSLFSFSLWKVTATDWELQSVPLQTQCKFLTATSLLAPVKDTLLSFPGQVIWTRKMKYEDNFFLVWCLYSIRKGPKNENSNTKDLFKKKKKTSTKILIGKWDRENKATK